MGKIHPVGFNSAAAQKPRGTFHWDCGRRKWQWVRGGGLNLALGRSDGTWRPMVHCETLREAGFYAEGYVAGEEDAEVLDVKD